MKLATLVCAMLLSVASVSGARTPAENQPVQSEPDTESVNRAVALASRFEKLHDPVVATYALASVASLICPQDKLAGSGIFIRAIQSLNVLPEAAFRVKSAPVFPVLSFAGLAAFVTSGAASCDPTLLDRFAADSIRARTEFARQNAPSSLDAATGLLKQNGNPERIAQLTAGALASETIVRLNTKQIAEILIPLAANAPELSDEIFRQALDSALRAPSSSERQLLELARYLFTAPTLVERPDTEGAEQVFPVSGRMVPNLGERRHSANPDVVTAYIDTVNKVLAGDMESRADPVIAYALASQMFPHAEDLALESAEPLRKRSADLGASTGSAASELEARLARSETPSDPETDPQRRHDLLAGRSLSELKRKRFGAAMDLYSRIDRPWTRAQLTELARFSEAAQDIRDKNFDTALLHANALRAGVKRALLYTGIAAGHQEADQALSILALAFKDIELLPAEQRAYLLMAIAKVLSPFDPPAGYTVLGQVVTALNDARISPRRKPFNPNSLKLFFNPSGDSSTDTSLILRISRGFFEVIDTGISRRNFMLEVPGADLFDLPALVKIMGRSDLERVESIILGLRDETVLTRALLAVAELRLKR